MMRADMIVSFRFSDRRKAAASTSVGTKDKLASLNANFSADLSRRKNSKIDTDLRTRIVHGIQSVMSKQWPADMAPNEQTISKAASLFYFVYSEPRLGGTEFPSITAAEDNSLDLFWGSRKKSLLVNIPSEQDEEITAHIIDGRGSNFMQISGGRFKDLAYLIREMRD